MTETYTLTVTGTQLEAISTACDVLCRLGLGQIKDALDYLPLKREVNINHELISVIGRVLSPLMIENIDGVYSSLGVYHEKVSPIAKVACDLHQVIRHHLAWESAIRTGLVPSMESTRLWPGMMSVDYDAPAHVSDQPLATIKKEDSR